MRRANTLFQLMTILEENHHSFLIVEHDHLLYEDSREMVGYLAQHLRQTSREAKVLLYAPALDLHLQKLTELANLGVLHLQRAGHSPEGRGEDTGSAEDAGGILMRCPGGSMERSSPGPMVSRAQELETAKEILAEVFHARPSEVEEMIQSRLEESEPEEREEGRWQATFCLGGQLWARASRV
jgi:hypothetical protein